MTKTAVILFNLGGPDSPEAVQPFLYNLFNDPAILHIPSPFRSLLAAFISRRRNKVAQEIYGHIGGKSPILEQTRAQAQALEKALEKALATETEDVRTFIAMRYWHPFTAETVRDVANWSPDRVVLLPLYPQFSTTTTASSVAEWRHVAARSGLSAPVHSICCYPTDHHFVESFANPLRLALAEAARKKPTLQPRVLFSAHGLPKRIIERGDPYAWQVKKTAAAIVHALGETDLDWSVTYQSRVGRLEWIGPATVDELRRAGGDNRPVVVVPLSFVSEHSETLVELDIQYRDAAMTAGVPLYIRVPTPGSDDAFIQGLAELVRAVMNRAGVSPCSGAGERLCPHEFGACPMAAAAATDAAA